MPLWECKMQLERGNHFSKQSDSEVNHDGVWRCVPPEYWLSEGEFVLPMIILAHFVNGIKAGWTEVNRRHWSVRMDVEIKSRCCRSCRLHKSESVSKVYAPKHYILVIFTSCIFYEILIWVQNSILSVSVYSVRSGGIWYCANWWRRPAKVKRTRSDAMLATTSTCRQLMKNAASWGFNIHQRRHLGFTLLVQHVKTTNST